MSGYTAKKVVADSCRHDIIPQYIHLPDGRQYLVDELMGRVTERRVFNRTVRSQPAPQRLHHRAAKYTQEERHWIARSTIAEVSERYCLTDDKAYNLINNSRIITGYNKRSRRDTE